MAFDKQTTLASPTGATLNLYVKHASGPPRAVAQINHGLAEHAYADGNYRIIGVADMAQAIRSGRPHRAGGELAFHVLEVMEAVQRSSDEGRLIAIESRPTRPAMLPTTLAKGELD